MSPIASTSPCSAETCGRGGRGCDRARAPPTHGLRSGRAHTGIGARRGPPRRRGRARGRSAAPAAPRAQRRLTCRRSSSCFCDIGLLPRPPILRSRCTGAPHPLHRAQCRPLLALSGPVAACASRLLLLHAASQPRASWHCSWVLGKNKKPVSRWTVVEAVCCPEPAAGRRRRPAGHVLGAGRRVPRSRTPPPDLRRTRASAPAVRRAGLAASRPGRVTGVSATADGGCGKRRRGLAERMCAPDRGGSECAVTAGHRASV